MPSEALQHKYCLLSIFLQNEEGLLLLAFGCQLD